MTKAKFYTGKGDHGDTTRLAGTTRISKSSALIEAVGTLDEATAAIGMARTLAQSKLLHEMLPEVQRHIYAMLAHLSAVPEQRERFTGLGEDNVHWLEEQIAKIESQIPPIHDLVLPGESHTGAAFHVARTVVRRAERRLVTFTEQESSFGEANLAYINRLSSLMFVSAILENALAKGDIHYAKKTLA